MTMKDEDEFLKELEQIAPELSKLQKVNAFKVEEQYFDSFPMAIMNKIQEKKSKRFVIDLSWLLQPRWAIAASFCFIALIAGSFIFFHRITADKPMPIAEVQKLLNEPVTREAVLDNVDADIMIETITAKAKSTNTKVKVNSKKSADKKALEEYIIDNADDSSITDDL